MNLFALAARRVQTCRVLLLLPPLLGAALRWPAVWSNRFHADETLFATWSRLIYYGDDRLLVRPGVDKTPLLFYLQAGFYPLFDGAAPWVARLPNVTASLLLIALTMQLARAVGGGQRAALAAGLLVALSPLAIQFSATGFTDPLLTVLVVGAVLAAGVNRPVAAGLLGALALAAKLQALLFLPLLLLVAPAPRRQRRFWSRWAAGAAAPLLLLLFWLGARGGPLTLWSTQMRNYGGLRLSTAGELWSGLRAWAEPGGLLLGRPAWTVGLVLLGVAGVLGWWVSRRVLGAGGDLCAGRPPHPNPLQAHACAGDRIWLFVGAYALVHWLLAIPAWDRYLLPLVPLVAVGVALPLERFGRLPGRAPRALATAVVLIALTWGALVPAWQARNGQWPVGGSPTADDGAQLTAAALARAPWGTVLYDHWYSWQWRYYFVHGPVYVSWFADPAALAEDVAAHGAGDTARYLAWPAAEAIAPLARALAGAGYALDHQDRFEAIDLYRIVADPAATEP